MTATSILRRALGPAALVALTALPVALSAALSVGCDTRATAANSGGATAERPAAEFESCGTTAHCGPELRCFDQTCVSTARSVLGDYLAARAARAAGAEAAIADYAEALATYEADKLAVPVDLDCAYGRALARAKAKPDKAELAARVLHRCLLAAPSGSRLRAEALAALVDLDGAGLDPKQLAKPALADLYLTRAPARPSADAVGVAVVADPAVTAKSFPAAVERIAAPDLRPALLACWDQHQAGGAVVARLPFKVTFKPSEFDDEPGVYKIAVDPPPAGDPGAACVHAVLGPALTATKGLKDKIETTLVVTLK